MDCDRITLPSGDEGGHDPCGKLRTTLQHQESIDSWAILRPIGRFPVGRTRHRTKHRRVFRAILQFATIARSSTFTAQLSIGLLVAHSTSGCGVEIRPALRNPTVVRVLLAVGQAVILLTSPLSVCIETPIKLSGGCSRITVSPAFRHYVVSPTVSDSPLSLWDIAEVLLMHRCHCHRGIV